ncbi:hypothetical protein EVAR_19679_1 [Eumeta japonica]|uniref:Uncharacterized protein n=1 Tax=Eumeta variegata TaxID=151549 RepID=A0A4C1V3H1_EUMVA|nr:hypothetical protein EVAR_19679_1 [Eumeta japonica]
MDNQLIDTINILSLQYESETSKFIIYTVTYDVCAKHKDSSEKNYGTPAENASYRSNAVSHTSSPHSILRASFRCQSATAYRGVRRPSAEAKCWRGYLRHDARMRSAARPV